MGVNSQLTVIAPAYDYSLLDLETAKAELNITVDTSDDWLNLAIGQVSRSIRDYVGMPFQVETVREIAHVQWYPLPYSLPHALRTSGDTHILQLSRSPLANFVVVPLAGAAAIGDRSLNLGSADGIAGIISGPGIPAGTTVNPDGNPQLSQAVTAAIPAGTPIAFGVEVRQQLPGVGTSDRGLYAGIDYLADPDTAQLHRLAPTTGGFMAWEQLPLTITYSSGYNTVPEDAVIAALRWISWRYFERGRDPALREQMQPGGGLQRTWWTGGPPMTGNVPSEVASLLSNYRPARVG